MKFMKTFFEKKVFILSQKLYQWALEIYSQHFDFLSDNLMQRNYSGKCNCSE